MIEMAARNGRRVLIVGGGGYLGTVMSGVFLKAGYEVTVFDRLTFGLEPLRLLKSRKGFTLIREDMRNLSAVSSAIRGKDAVVLLAALVGEAACNLDPYETVDVNYLAARNLLETANYYKVPRFLFASTDSCYGAQKGVELNEQSPLKPLSLYAELKVELEKRVLGLANYPLFNPTVLRLATVYGLSPRMRFDLMLNSLILKAARDKKMTIYSGEQWRPLVHIVDVARAFLLAAQSKAELVSGQVFNVGANDQNVQFKDLAGLITSVIPDVELEFAKDQPDLCDCRVNFDKITSVLGFGHHFKVADGIAGLHKALKKGLFANAQDSIYYNAQKYGLKTTA